MQWAFQFTDYVQSLRNLRQDLIESRPQEALRMANDTYALAKRRIINGGEKADGSRFEDTQKQ